MFIIVPKSKRMWGIVLAVLAVLCLLGSGLAFAGSLDIAEPTDITTITKAELETGNTYWVDELVIIDACASYPADSSDPAYYLLAGFWDMNQDLCVGQLRVDSSDEIYEDVVDYINDDTQEIGALRMSAYISLGDKTTYEDVNEYYDERVADYIESGYFDEADITNFGFSYRANGALSVAEYMDKEADQGKTYAGVALAFALIFGVLAFLLLKKKAATVEKITYTGNGANDKIETVESQFESELQKDLEDAK